MTKPLIPVFFDDRQLAHKPRYEWAFGEKIDHPETTSRAENILAAIERAALQGEPTRFSVRPPGPTPLAAIRRVHDPRLMSLYRAAEKLEPGSTFYPSVFPQRARTTPSEVDVRHAGYFCFDSGTPLAPTTWDAATLSVACAWSAADAVVAGEAPFAYALCRPPGHHAERGLFGGYCYFNNAAIVAKRLRARGRVAIVDIDFHHGNGTQALFYRDPEVLFVSIHGDPREFYPYFAGHPHETGEGPGKGFNLNVPLPRGCDAQGYLDVLDRLVLDTVRRFDPASLVISAGFDTYREDPIGDFTLDTPDFHPVGERLGRLGLPTVVLQEGGYCTDRLGANVVTFLHGVQDGLATSGG